MRLDRTGAINLDLGDRVGLLHDGTLITDLHTVQFGDREIAIVVPPGTPTGLYFGPCARHGGVRWGVFDTDAQPLWSSDPLLTTPGDTVTVKIHYEIV